MTKTFENDVTGRNELQECGSNLGRYSGLPSEPNGEIVFSIVRAGHFVVPVSCLPTTL